MLGTRIEVRHKVHQKTILCALIWDCRENRVAAFSLRLFRQKDLFDSFCKFFLDCEAEVIKDRIWDRISIKRKAEGGQTFVFCDVIKLRFCNFTGHTFEGADADNALDFFLFIGCERCAYG